MSLPASPLPASSVEINEFSFNCTRRLGCSQLMEVRNTRTGVMHCGKLIPKSAVPQFLQQEGLVYKVLKAHPHPNILLPKTVVEGDEYCGVIFDTVGEDVHTYVRRCGSGLPEREAKAVFHSIASAIAHMHSLRIVARDLRLGKIFLQDAKSLNVVLADLDGAQMVSRENPFLSDRKGSPAFVSPEVVVAPSFDAAAADMWALGVVLYILLRGAYPFHDTHPATLFQKIQQGHSAIYFHPSMSEAACDIIRSLLTKEPHLRLTGAQLMKDLWFSTPTVSTAPSAFLQAVPSARAPLATKRPATKPLSEEVILERLKRMKNIVSPGATSPSRERDVDPVVLL